MECQKHWAKKIGAKKQRNLYVDTEKQFILKWEKFRFSMKYERNLLIDKYFSNKNNEMTNPLVHKVWWVPKSRNHGRKMNGKILEMAKRSRNIAAVTCKSWTIIAGLRSKWTTYHQESMQGTYIYICVKY